MNRLEQAAAFGAMMGKAAGMGKRAEGALPKQFQGLEGFPLPGRPKMGPGHPLYRPAPGPGGALKGMPSPSKPPEAFPTKSSVMPGPNDVDPRYTPGMSAHGKYMDDIASMTPEGREHKLRQSMQQSRQNDMQNGGFSDPRRPNPPRFSAESREAFPTKSSVMPGPNDVDPRYTPGMSDYDKYRQGRPGQ